MKIIVILTLTLAFCGTATAAALFTKAELQTAPPETGQPRTLTQGGPNQKELIVMSKEEQAKFDQKTHELEVQVHDYDNPPDPNQTPKACGLNPAEFWTRVPRKTINMIHFNDVYEIRYESFWVTELRKYMEALRNPAIIFSGDIIGPSLVSQKLKSPGFQFKKLFLDFKIDVSVPGNHEGDKGENNFMKFTNLNYVDSGPEWSTKEEDDQAPEPHTVFKKKPGLWLLANLRPKYMKRSTFTKEFSPAWGNLRGATILQMNGFKFGFFGLIDENWINGSGVKPERDKYIYTPFLDAAREYSHMLKKAGCHFVGAVTHMTNVHDREVLEDSTNSVDFVFGGHEHIFLVERKNNRVLLKSGSDFKQFSALRFELFENKEKFEEWAKEVGTKVQGSNPAETITDNTFSFVLDELNLEQMKVRHWNFPAEFSYPPKDQNGTPYPLPSGDEDIAKFTYLNIYLERVDISFADPATKDPEFDGDFKKAYLPLLKNEMVPVFHFRDPVDAREPQIYSGEMPIGDFLTDIVKADNFADIVMLNAGSVKSEFAFPKDTVIMKADAMRMLQRPSKSLRSVPTVRSVTKLFDKWFAKYNQFSPDLPYFSGVFIDIHAENGKYQKCVLKDAQGEPLPLDKRVQFISLLFTADVTTEDPVFIQDIPNELQRLQEEYLAAVMAADRKREMVDYYEESLSSQGPDQKQGYLIQSYTVEDWTKDVSRAVQHRSALNEALTDANEAMAVIEVIEEAKSHNPVDEFTILRKTKRLNELSRNIFFPTSKEYPDTNKRPYDSLEKFFVVANQMFTNDYMANFGSKATEGLSAYEIMDLWKKDRAPLDQVPALESDEQWPGADVLSDAPVSYGDKAGVNKITNKKLAFMRTVQSEEFRRTLNFLALHLNYKFERKTADYIIPADGTNPERQEQVDVISVNPVVMNRLKIIDPAQNLRNKLSKLV